MTDGSIGTNTVMATLADPRRQRVLVALNDCEPPVSVHELAVAMEDVETDGASPIVLEPATDGGVSSGNGDDADGGISSDDAFEAGGWSTDHRNDERDPDGALDVAASLYHVHLPKLDDAGLVSFDSDAKELSEWELDGLADEPL